MKKLIDRTTVRYVEIGVLNMLFCTAIMYLLYNLTRLSSWACAFINHALGGVISYSCNRRFVFREKKRSPKTLALFVLVNMLISMLLLGGSVTLLPAMLLAAGCAEAAMACSGGMRKPWAPVLGVAVYDLTSKVFSLGVSWLFMRESPALLYVIVPIVVIGYVGSLCGLFSGVRAVRELRHAGIVRN